MCLVACKAGVILLTFVLHQAIEEAGDRNATPKDYLNFFMLANRERRLPDEPQPEKHPKKGSPAAAAQRSRRSPVYVHSKTLVIDDEVRCAFEGELSPAPVPSRLPCAA